jgi:pimeloyl-ACP methyl ester carboxylesterase
MAQLTGTAQAIPLGQGYAVRSPGIRGSANLKTTRSAVERGRSRALDDGTAELDAALAASNVTEVRRIELQLQPPSPADATRSLRSVDGQETLELEVPDLGLENGQLVLACDEAGVLTWHLPVDTQLDVQNPSTRGAGSVKRFRIPATQPRPAPASDAAQRGIIGVIERKVLKVLVYPVTDPIIGAISEFFAERWETRNRPYGLRSFTPGERKTPGVGALTSADWDRLCSGRALLFIHGTFSTAHGGFALISDATFGALHERYGQRVFAFNHFTLSHDPRKNIDWLLQNVPSGRSLEVDIVCHSRGGLVARALAEQMGTLPIKVRRIVFVAVPNQGTALANPDHMVKMIDRFTTALNFFPTGPVAETLEALITAVKMIGHGALKGLDGLASMRPGGDFLRSLNSGVPKGDGYYAIAVDYEPIDEGLRALITGKIADAVLDRVFADAANDLVVPESGVYSKNGSGAFPIADARLLRVASSAGVIHTTVFGHAPVSEKLTEWLT